MELKQIFVTGGMGFIGSNFVRYMLGRYDHEILVLDKLTYAGNPDNLKDYANDERLTFVMGDICDQTLVNRLMDGIDWVVHFAAETHVDRSIQEAGIFVQTDVFGTFVVLEAARKNNIKRFMHISTDEVYGEALGKPSTEEDPLMPKSPYAASKAGADRLAYAYCTTYGLPIVITRCTNNYGPYQHLEKLIPLFVTNALQDKPLPVYGTGENSRDWIYVLDHCEALDMLLKAKGFEGDVFNIGANEEHKVLEIADIILATLGKPKNLIKFVKDRPGHVLRHAVSTEKIRKALQWKPRHKFEEGMKETIQWYVNNEWWWKGIKSGEGQ